MIDKVGSLAELLMKAKTDERYAKLAVAAASNLGSMATNATDACRYLLNEAMETSETGVVAEVNFCRDLVEE